MSIADNQKTLASNEFFALFSGDQLRLVAFGAETVTLSAEETLFEEGEAADCAYLLVEGTIEFVGGYKEETLEEAVPGDLIGMLALINPNQKRAADAMAREHCTLLRVPRTAIIKVLEEYPQTAARLHDYISDKVRTFTRALKPLQQSLEE